MTMIMSARSANHLMTSAMQCNGVECEGLDKRRRMEGGREEGRKGVSEGGRVRDMDAFMRESG